MKAQKETGEISETNLFSIFYGTPVFFLWFTWAGVEPELAG